MSQTKNVVCPGCTLLCDDIEISRGGSTTRATNACSMGQSFFEIKLAQPPVHYVSGNPVDLAAAIGSAADMLSQSNAPLICGLDQLTTQAQQTAWKIADQIGAAIDTTLTNEGRSSMFSLQRTGKVTASLGEIANRSDLIVFWFCDPETTHPRLLERLARPEDHPQRQIIVVDENESPTARKSDRFIQVQHQHVPSVLATVRARVRGRKLDESCAGQTTDVDDSQINTLVKLFESAKYGSIFYGQPTSDSAFDLAADSLNSLVRELNDITRFVGMKLRRDTNAQSAENVLAWSTGYPFAINHNRSFPRFNWLEYSAESILARRECDAVLLASGHDQQEALGGLSKTSREFLESIPTIALSPMANFPAKVAIQVGIPGLTCSGEFCRNDDVSLPLNSVGTVAVSPDDVLESLRQQLS